MHTQSRARLECDDCGLVYVVETVNLVDSHGADRRDPVSNHCPNCGGDAVEPWTPGGD